MSTPESSTSGLDGDGVRAELQRILASDVFSKAPILSRFLSYLVQLRIDGGDTTPPKEYTIGVDVFERGADFDPRVDTIVRVQARRLRKRLSGYYEDRGRNDPVRITVPKGHYQVEIADAEQVKQGLDEPRNPPEPPAAGSGTSASVLVRREGAAPRRRWAAGIGVAVLVVLIAGAVYWRFAYRQGTKVRHTAAAAVVSMPASHATPPSAPAPVGLPAAAPIPEQSVAVLPFVNESGQSDQQFFSDGLSEDLITAMSQFSGLKVINRDSSFQFRHSRDSIQVIGQKLGVAHLLEGSVQRAGSEVRISAELVDTNDGRIVWSHRYDQPYADLFKLQDDITRAVTAALKTRLLAGDESARQTDRPRSGNLAAYDAMLRGRFLADRGDQTDWQTAARYEERAIQLDPNYAYAWAELSH
ncbi:MAG: FlgO family outer membrane protein, partial [Rhodanobacteraceae bacterium]